MTIEAPPLFVQGGTYPARLDRFLIAQTYDEGIMSPLACKVVQRAAGANFTVDVGVGAFVIQGDDQSLQGNYMGRITATDSGTIGAAPAGSNKRIDLVTLRVNDPNAGGNSGNTVSIVVVAGTQTTGTPVAPALPASSIALATVGPITSSTASITNAIITDVRVLAGPKAPTGEMRVFAGGVSMNGWLYCNGQAVSRTTYADLFSVLGTTFGAGDGSTTFNVPDLRDRVPVAAGATFSTNGATGGEVNHTLTTGEMPSHNHGGTVSNEDVTHYHNVLGNTGTESATHTHPPASGQYFFDGPNGTAAYPASGGNTLPATINSPQAQTGTESATHTHSVNINSGTESALHTHTVFSQGGGGGHNNMPPYQVVSGWLIHI